MNNITVGEVLINALYHLGKESEGPLCTFNGLSVLGHALNSALPEGIKVDIKINNPEEVLSGPDLMTWEKVHAGPAYWLKEE